MCSGVSSRFTSVWLQLTGQNTVPPPFPSKARVNVNVGSRWRTRGGEGTALDSCLPRRHLVLWHLAFSSTLVLRVHALVSWSIGKAIGLRTTIKDDRISTRENLEPAMCQAKTSCKASELHRSAFIISSPIFVQPGDNTLDGATHQWH